MPIGLAQEIANGSASGSGGSQSAAGITLASGTGIGTNATVESAGLQIGGASMSTNGQNNLLPMMIGSQSNFN